MSGPNPTTTLRNFIEVLAILAELYVPGEMEVEPKQVFRMVNPALMVILRTLYETKLGLLSVKMFKVCSRLLFTYMSNWREILSIISRYMVIILAFPFLNCFLCGEK